MVLIIPSMSPLYGSDISRYGVIISKEIRLPTVLPSHYRSVLENRTMKWGSTVIADTYHNCGNRTASLLNRAVSLPDKELRLILLLFLRRNGVFLPISLCRHRVRTISSSIYMDVGLWSLRILAKFFPAFLRFIVSAILAIRIKPFFSKCVSLLISSTQFANFSKFCFFVVRS